MITQCQLKVILSGNPDKIFDEVAQPDLRFEIVARFSAAELSHLLSVIDSTKLIPLVQSKAESDPEMQTILRLLQEFIQIVK